ncbi:ABC transporter permease subunit [Herbidospora mongoliensis]|uniref:ABC transporter permease subunit n=1 Tax=Herbidospora mongoliensis TaxID=688067 RepID=UPI000A07595A|nr:hypothetical protein [Herbidospora mongoliensis]
MSTVTGHRRPAVGEYAGDRRRAWPYPRASLAVAVLAAASVPFVVPPFPLYQVTLVLVYVVALLGLDLVTGHGGQISLGHGAFLGIGAYVAAILLSLDVPYPVTLPAAGLVAYGLGHAFGWPAVRRQRPADPRAQLLQGPGRMGLRSRGEDLPERGRPVRPRRRPFEFPGHVRVDVRRRVRHDDGPDEVPVARGPDGGGQGPARRRDRHPAPRHQPLDRAR